MFEIVLILFRHASCYIADTVTLGKVGFGCRCIYLLIINSGSTSLSISILNK